MKSREDWILGVCAGIHLLNEVFPSVLNDKANSNMSDDTKITLSILKIAGERGITDDEIMTIEHALGLRGVN